MRAHTFKNLLVNATGTGPGAPQPIDLHGAKSTWQITYTDADNSITALTVSAEGSLDGTFWYALATYQFKASDITAKGAMFHIVDKMANFLRANVIAVNGLGAGDKINCIMTMGVG